MRKLIFSIFKKDPNEIQSLHGIRAIGSALVIYHHFGGVTNALLGYDFKLFGIVFDNLYSAMDAFFILSAFLVSGGLNHLLKKSGTINYKNYFFKRTIRIFPAYYIFLFVMVLVSYSFINNPANKNEFIDTFRGFRDYWIYDVLYLSNYSTHSLVPHGWTLAIEEQFYLFLPFLFYFLHKGLNDIRRLYVLVLLYIIPLIFRLMIVPSIETDNDYTGMIHHPTHTHADSLIMGILIMEIFFNHKKIYNLLTSGTKGTLFLLGGTALYGASHFIPFIPQSVLANAFKINFFNIGLGIIFLFTLNPASLIARFLSMKIFLPFARVSYSMYLWHMSSLGIVGAYFYKLHTVPSYATIFLALVSSLIVSFILGWAGYLIVEAPFLHLKDMISGKMKISLTNKHIRESHTSGKTAARDRRFLAAMLDIYTYSPTVFLYLFSIAIPEHKYYLYIAAGITFLIAASVQIIFILKYSASVGKKLYHLKVISSSGININPWKYMFIRGVLANIFFIKIPLGILLETVFFSMPGNRTLRDRITKTHVIETDGYPDK